MRTSWTSKLLGSFFVKKVEGGPPWIKGQVDTGDMKIEQLTEEERELMKTPMWELLAKEGSAEVVMEDPVEAGMLAGQLLVTGMPLLGAVDVRVEREEEGLGPYYVVVELRGARIVA
jgi:hypothetical protein